jgi:hypothetical protein
VNPWVREANSTERSRLLLAKVADCMQLLIASFGLLPYTDNV